MSALLPKGASRIVVGLVTYPDNCYEFVTQKFTTRDGIATLADIQKAFYLLDHGAQIIAIVNDQWAADAVMNAFHAEQDRIINNIVECFD